MLMDDELEVFQSLKDRHSSKGIPIGTRPMDKKSRLAEYVVTALRSGNISINCEV